MEKPRCRLCDAEIEHEFAFCPNCKTKKVEVSLGGQMEALSGVKSVSQSNLESLQGVIKIVSIPMESEAFSIREQNEIVRRIDDLVPELLEIVKTNSKKIEKIESDQEKIRVDLEYIKEELRSQKKRTWHYIFLGIITKWISENILTPQLAEMFYQGIMNIIIEVLSNVG